VPADAAVGDVFMFFSVLVASAQRGSRRSRTHRPQAAEFSSVDVALTHLGSAGRYLHRPVRINTYECIALIQEIVVNEYRIDTRHRETAGRAFATSRLKRLTSSRRLRFIASEQRALQNFRQMIRSTLGRKE